MNIVVVDRPIVCLTRGRSLIYTDYICRRVRNILIAVRKYLHGEKFISKLYFFYKKIHYFYSDAGTHSKYRIFTVLNSTF